MAYTIANVPCRDVLDPRFVELNAPAGYSPNINFGGSDWIRQHFHVALPRYYWGADLNPAFWLHDADYSADHALGNWDEDNDILRDNIVKLVSAAGHPWIARAIAWAHWIGVQSIPALLDFFLCEKKTMLTLQKTTFFTRSFWTGAGMVLTGIGMLFSPDSKAQGIQLIGTGLITIFLRDALAKAVGK